MKKLVPIFLLAFALNFVWENLHAGLYANYKGGTITEWVLFRATFWDAVFITLFALLFIYISYFRKRLWWVIVLGIVLGAGIERWALATHRWAYTPRMPIVPVLHTGLTPTLQLGLLAYVVFYIVLKEKTLRP